MNAGTPEHHRNQPTLGRLLTTDQPIAAQLPAILDEPLRTYTTRVEPVRATAHTARVLRLARWQTVTSVGALVIGSKTRTWHLHIQHWLRTDHVPPTIRTELFRWDLALNLDQMLAPYQPHHEIRWHGIARCSDGATRYARTRLTHLDNQPAMYTIETIISALRSVNPGRDRATSGLSRLRAMTRQAVS